LAVGVGALLAGVGLWFWLGGSPGIMHPWVAPEAFVTRFLDFRLQMILLVLGGLLGPFLAGTELWERRDRVALALAWWLGSVFFFTVVLNWTMNVRSFLSAVPAVAILVARRLEGQSGRSRRWLWLPIGLAAVATLSVAFANWQLANAERAAALKIAAKHQSPGHTLWLNGHSGFQYYLERAGGQTLDVERSSLLPGDVVATPMQGNFVTLPPGSVNPLNDLSMRPSAWMNLQGWNAHAAAGFFTADDGPLPFAVGVPSPREYFMVKVLMPVQFHTQPANPREMLAGAVPSFTNGDYSVSNTLAVPANPAAAEQVAAAGQLLAAGNEAAAIQRYEGALVIQSNNPEALSRLALVLASASRPDLRNPARAVHLANQAVKLTDSREAVMLVILARAYAADGQWPKAEFAERIGRDLALVTGQTALAESGAKLIQRPDAP
jgi:hypothetical protein